MSNEPIVVKFSYSEFKPYLDKFNLISQNSKMNHDGGDSSHRFGSIVTALKYIDSKKWVDGTTDLDDYVIRSISLSYRDFKEHKYRRHEDPEKWYSNPFNTSRDQTMMLQDAALSFGLTLRAEELFIPLLKNFGFHFNYYPNYTKPGDADYKKKVPDFIHPSQISTYIRTTKNKLLYPILLISDLVYLIDIPVAMYDDYNSKKKGKRTDQYTMIITNMIANEGKMPTPWFYLAKKILKHVDYYGAIDWIFGNPENNDPPVHKLLVPVIKSIIENRKIILDISE